MSEDTDSTNEYEDPHTCQECGITFDFVHEGYYVDTVDVGPDAEGGTAEVFRLDVEDQLGDEWLGFKEEDIGPWCHYCSWKIQQRRKRSQ